MLDLVWLEGPYSEGKINLVHRHFEISLGFFVDQYNFEATTINYLYVMICKFFRWARPTSL